jgi:hypothetical protein
LVKIFKKNLFEDKKLIPIVKELIGEGGCKPFECIGTREESLAAFYLCLKKFRKKPLPVVLEYFEKNILSKYSNIDKISEKFYS